ncbi:MAG: hypothetical protein A3K18_29085 [Lentisphaerae bacterium RIFOXYA12_64_32]|nr:MAG: hypothetical protein A3K18_29085 [Lentisphaerae bacterium RIFOXYA12_64_32]
MSSVDKRISVRTILCDIDSTITDLRPGTFGGDFRDAVFQLFSRHIAARMNLAESAARETLDNFANNLLVWWDYPDFITHFALDPEAVWDDMRRLHNDALFIHEDAVEMVRTLSRNGRELHIVSNNPVTGCLLKLERAGLASLRGSPYFQRIFGTNETKGMKSQPRMWRWILAALNADPSDVLTIGDSVKEDFEAPRQAGITHTIIVDRNLGCDILEGEGLVRVKSLARVRELIELD